MKHFPAVTVLGLVLLASFGAHAENLGSIEVDCEGPCDTVNLGQICNAFAADSTPVGVACNHRTDLGGWRPYDCGVATCVRGYDRFDSLADYCDDGPASDAVVTCSKPE